MPSTRRRALRATAGAVAAGLAGCSALSGDDERERRGERLGTPITDYNTERVVVEDEQRLVDWPDEDRDVRGQSLLATAEDREGLAFPTDATTPVESFLDATAFDASAVLLFQRQHGACYRLDAYRPAAKPDEISAHLCTETRPADEPCSADADRTTLLALRLPVDARDRNHLSVTESSDCSDRFGPRSAGGEGE
ncbi:hypothetical protein [Halorubellus sp. PRR65]|uniref:hypothetical protein n=1 Tax=Halorubellus sp. PRR65 TaxID=3098148 RepID=UPI002B263EE4|nr:hypothetical protein [Halorubellus sp. PRR65]